VGENSAQTNSGPGQPLEPVSASNRFDFDLLAEYNSAAPMGLHRATKAQAEAGVKAAGEQPEAQIAPRPVPAPLPNAQAPGQRPGRPPYTGARRPVPARQMPVPGGPQ
jgi:hypothetical protein